MGGKLAPFCMDSCKNLYWTTRVPGKEIDRTACYTSSKPPKHVIIYR